MGGYLTTSKKSFVSSDNDVRAVYGDTRCMSCQNNRAAVVVFCNDIRYCYGCFLKLDQKCVTCHTSVMSHTIRITPVDVTRKKRGCY